MKTIEYIDEKKCKEYLEALKGTSTLAIHDAEVTELAIRKFAEWVRNKDLTVEYDDTFGHPTSEVMSVDEILAEYKEELK